MNKNAENQNSEQLYMTITLILNEAQCHRFLSLAKGKNILGGITILGKGTVNNATLNILGIKSQKNEVITVLVKKENAFDLLNFFEKHLELSKPGNGIAYSASVQTAKQLIEKKEISEMETKNIKEQGMYKKISIIVNRGMADDVMDIARKSGITGGTVLHGRGVNTEIRARFLGMEIEPEKELVMILLPNELVENLVENIHKELHLDKPGNGILFVESVIEARGLYNASLNEDQNR